MPHRIWKHFCMAEGRERSHSRPSCEHCHALGMPAGWSYSAYERMGVYQQLYRLKPLGRHKRMADDLLEHLTGACEACHGEGLVDAEFDWAYCNRCRGLGRFFTVSLTKVNEVRALVLAEYPDAAAGSVFEQPPHRSRPRKDPPLPRVLGDPPALPTEYKQLLTVLQSAACGDGTCGLNRAAFSTPYTMSVCPGCLERELRLLRDEVREVPQWALHLEKAASREIERQRGRAT